MIGIVEGCVLPEPTLKNYTFPEGTYAPQPLGTS
jgi:hypothetical protein